MNYMSSIRPNSTRVRKYSQTNNGITNRKIFSGKKGRLFGATCRGKSPDAEKEGPVKPLGGLTIRKGGRSTTTGTTALLAASYLFKH